MARVTTSGLDLGKKRKRSDETSYALKKKRTVALNPPQEVDFQDQTLQLEEKILESRTNYNSIHTLLGHLRENDEAQNKDIIATVALCRIFCRLMAGGYLSKQRESSSDEATIVQWLRDRLQDYEQALLRMLRNKIVGKQSTALTVAVRLVKEKASLLDQSDDAVWQNGLFGLIVQTLVEEEVAEETRAEFVEKYVKEYDDVRYYTFACLAYVEARPDRTFADPLQRPSLRQSSRDCCTKHPRDIGRHRIDPRTAVRV